MSEDLGFGRGANLIIHLVEMIHRFRIGAAVDCYSMISSFMMSAMVSTDEDKV